MIWKEHPDGVIIFSHHHPYKDGSAEAIKDLLLGLFNTSHWKIDESLSSFRPRDDFRNVTSEILRSLGPLKKSGNVYIAGEDPRAWITCLSLAITIRKHDLYSFIFPDHGGGMELTNLFDQDISRTIPLTAWTPSILKIDIWAVSKTIAICRHEIQLLKIEDIPLLEQMNAIAQVSEKIGLEPSEWMEKKV